MAAYVPCKGDFIAVTSNPQSGHEQKGRRPALVVSNDVFNRHTKLAIVCPVTNTYRGSPFHVAISDHPSLTGFVMVEQVKSLDLGARDARRIGAASDELLSEVLAILDACIYDDEPGSDRL